MISILQENKMKKIFTLLLIMLTSWLCFADGKTLYQGGVYGQSFELVEFTESDTCRLLLFMSDNKNTNKSGVTFYDSSLPTVYSIWSKPFSNPSEYSKAVKSSKEFLDVTMNYVYLADIKDICDIAPCCKNLNYKVIDLENGKHIFIEYECSDLELFFEIARMYNFRGRDYVMQKYLK